LGGGGWGGGVGVAGGAGGVGLGPPLGLRAQLLRQLGRLGADGREVLLALAAQAVARGLGLGEDLAHLAPGGGPLGRRGLGGRRDGGVGVALARGTGLVAQPS